MREKFSCTPTASRGTGVRSQPCFSSIPPQNHPLANLIKSPMHNPTSTQPKQQLGAAKSTYLLSVEQLRIDTYISHPEPLVCCEEEDLQCL
ncbi:hypothetical protein I7I48_03789 [Histoplasma ohiense]|nr:hypothetical protein I7I48_03789 [Histoplasma ohiense (nom. inval.)]